MKPTKLGFEKRYYDDSGVEFGVTYEKKPYEPITIEHVNSIDWPLEELDWLIECLEEIRNAIQGTTNSESQSPTEEK